MPSAEPRQETMSSSEAADPFLKAVTYLKFKIKNMDQRKKNLENIQQKITDGQQQELEAAQVAAVAKLPEVTSNIGFLEHTLARLMTHRDEAAKLERARKQQAKLERVQQDLVRLRRVLLIQDALVNIDERVRAALLAGSGSAPQLTETQLQQIDAIYKLVTPSRDEEAPLQDQMAAAAEHLLRLADRSQKKVTGTTYDSLSRTLEAVFESGVLSRAAEHDLKTEEQQEEQQQEEVVVKEEVSLAPAENGVELAEPEPVSPAEPEPTQPELEPEPVPAPAVAAAQPAVAADQQQLLAAGAAPGSAGDGPAYPQEVQLVPVPVPVPVVPQLPQPPPINFLQESELLRADPAVVSFQPVPAPEYHQIPTQTFTNTNFAALAAPAAALSDYVSAGGVYRAAAAVVDTTPNPPPPIPLPRHEPAAPEPPLQPAVVAAPQQPSPPLPAAPQQQQADNAWALRQPTPAAAAAEPSAPAPVPAPVPAVAAAAPAPVASTAAWGDQDGDTEIGQWDSSSGQTSWENGNIKPADSWAENGDAHWGGNDGRRGGFRSRGGPRGRGQANGGGGYGGRGRGGYDRPPRGGARGGYGGDDRRGGYDDRQERRGGDSRREAYDSEDRRGGYAGEDRRRGYDDRQERRGGEQRRGGSGAERPYRGGRGGGRGTGRGGRGGGGPPRQQ